MDKILATSWSKVAGLIIAVAAVGSALLAYINRENDHWILTIMLQENYHLLLPFLPVLALFLLAMITSSRLLIPNFTQIGIISSYELTRMNFVRPSLLLGSIIVYGMLVGFLVSSLAYSAFIVAREYKYHSRASIDIASNSLFKSLRKDVNNNEIVEAYKKAKPFYEKYPSTPRFQRLVDNLDARKATAEQLEKVAIRAQRDNKRATAFLVAHAAYSVWPDEGKSQEIYLDGLQNVESDWSRYQDIAALCASGGFEKVADLVEQDKETIIDVSAKPFSQDIAFAIGKDICLSELNQDLLYEEYWRPEN